VQKFKNFEMRFKLRYKRLKILNSFLFSRLQTNFLYLFEFRFCRKFKDGICIRNNCELYLRKKIRGEFWRELILLFYTNKSKLRFVNAFEVFIRAKLQVT